MTEQNTQHTSTAAAAPIRIPPLPIMQHVFMRNNSPPTDEMSLRAKMEAADSKMEQLLREDLGITA